MDLGLHAYTPVGTIMGAEGRSNPFLKRFSDSNKRLFRSKDRQRGCRFEGKYCQIPKLTELFCPSMSLVSDYLKPIIDLMVETPRIEP